MPSNHPRSLFHQDSLEAPKWTPSESMFQDHKKVLRRFFPRDTTLLWSQLWPLSTRHFFGTIHRTRYESLRLFRSFELYESVLKGQYSISIVLKFHYLLCWAPSVSIDCFEKLYWWYGNRRNRSSAHLFDQQYLQSRSCLFYIF